MCGIAGLVSCNKPIKADVLKNMSDLVTYRGPDDEGFACWGDVRDIEMLERTNRLLHREKNTDARVAIAFGHRRLSILDLSQAGRQPMSSPDGRYWIVFNGEIYNYREIREQLYRKGHAFRSCSDTEVILAAYAEWGDRCLQLFNGMWAFAIYDSETQSLFCSRDRFGVKPFYFAVDQDRFGFASEIKQLRAAGFGTGRAHRSGVAQFLLYGNSNVARETLFEGIHQLLPGEALYWNVAHSPNAIRIIRYYSPHINHQMAPNGELEEYRQSFQDLITDAIKLRLRSDVPVGTCLSGGLDSSAIVTTANRLLRSGNSHKPQQKTFTSCFQDREFDEWSFASKVVSATGVNACTVFPQMEKLWDELSELTWHQDEPFGSTSVYAQWNVMRLARDNGVKVLLDGQGADEVMAGYHYFVLDYIISLLRSWQIRNTVQSLLSMRQTGILDAAVLSKSCSAWQLLMRAGRRLLGLPSLRPAKLCPVIRSEHVAPNKQQEVGFQALLWYAIFGSLQALLRYEDRNSMAFSVEARTPFLDYRIVELFLNMPGIYKIRDGWTKPFVREAMAGSMPDEVRLRVDKKGFVTPESAWIHGNLDRIRKLLLNSNSPIQLWLDQPKLRKWLLGNDCLIQGEFSLWRAISVHCWMERFDLA